MKSRPTFKKLLNFIFISTGVTILIVAICSIVVLLFVIFSVVKSSRDGKRIYKDFYSEIAEVPSLIVNRFDVNSWDGNSRAIITIPNKGKVDMYYYGKGRFSMLSIGDYSLLFPCEDRQYSTWLYKGSPYLNWFPEVNSLTDLTKSYDAIIASIKKLPTIPTEGYYTYHDSKDIFRFKSKIKCDLIQKI